MKIIRDEQAATWTFIPTKADEEDVLLSIIAILPKDNLSYSGRTVDSDDGESCIVHLHAGAREERQRKTDGNVTITRSVFIGGTELVLQGSSEDDKKEVGRIRDTCCFGSGGLIFLGKTVIDGKIAIITTAMLCPHCGAQMINRCACEWKTCDVCATKCEHIYTHGVIHGNGIDIGIGEFCKKCGRGKPLAEGGREKTIIEHHLAVERTLGIRIIYKGFPGNPDEVVKAKRLIRRYEKSLQRREAISQG